LAQTNFVCRLIKSFGVNEGLGAGKKEIGTKTSPPGSIKFVVISP